MMLLQPSPLRPSLPLSRHPSPLFSPLPNPLRSPLSLSFTPSALSRRGRSSPLNRRRQSDGDTDAEAAWDLDDDIEVFDEEAFGERRPRGFVAEGARYDTSLEERLLKEIVQGNHHRKDGTENLNKDKVRVRVKRESEKTKNKGLKLKKNSANVSNKIVSSAMTSGIRVRLWNLPRKKNIHRDLQTAFKGFRGILHIEPANSGNKKTRDPVCKGFAFVELATDEVATRFVETYSNKSISFGRIEKPISCCIINQNANSTTVNPNGNPATKKLSNHHKSPMLEPQLHDGFMGISEKFSPSDESPIIFVEEDEEKDEDEEISLSSFEMLNFDDEEMDEEESASEITEVPSEKKKKAAGLRRRRVRPRRATSSKLSLPLRLKGRERDVLTGVFTKYSVNSEGTTRKS